MRVVMTEKMKKLWKEIEPYFDFSRESFLRVDTPKEIRIKAQEFDELDQKNWEETMLTELGFIPEEPHAIINRMAI